MVTTGSNNKPNDEYYTPPEVFETLGIRFDLDVSAPCGGVDWLPAQQHFCIHDDGLTQQWHGNVWMNPPFSQSKHWVERFTQHANGIALLPTSRARWFGNLWNDHRALFVHPTPDRSMFTFVHNGKRANIYMPVVLVAYGNHNHEAIEKIGYVR